MDCNQARRELELMREQNSADLLAHLRRCADCREGAEDLRIARLLRTMPAPEPAEDFERRALAAAMPQSRERSRVRGWQLATAASLLLAVLMAVPRWQQPAAPAPEAVAALPVSVSLDTPRSLSGATIQVSLPPNLALEGYGDARQLQWQADLSAGANRLTLPVQMRQTGGEAEIVIRIEHEGARREFRVPVQAGSADRSRPQPTTKI
ncbi:hypothetical protein [Microbulbifer halophilus]|uniref:Zinc-finger domain-containing protein n=1 Tax=Microbulbifer halophilus TaxID=453963 RepID=A0ABW5E7Q2_9GAMM|nr:hypothetical protein [Microbulbifer halophilus]MCW8126061.1 hypothetical protein [Microbulbifer halophilus]